MDNIIENLSIDASSILANPYGDENCFNLLPNGPLDEDIEELMRNLDGSGDFDLEPSGMLAFTEGDSLANFPNDQIYDPTTDYLNKPDDGQYGNNMNNLNRNQQVLSNGCLQSQDVLMNNTNQIVQLNEVCIRNWVILFSFCRNLICNH